MIMCKLAAETRLCKLFVVSVARSRLWKAAFCAAHRHPVVRHVASRVPVNPVKLSTQLVRCRGLRQRERANVAEDVRRNSVRFNVEICMIEHPLSLRGLRQLLCRLEKVAPGIPQRRVLVRKRSWGRNLAQLVRRATFDSDRGDHRAGPGLECDPSLDDVTRGHVDQRPTESVVAAVAVHPKVLRLDHPVLLRDELGLEGHRVGRRQARAQGELRHDLVEDVPAPEQAGASE